MWLSLEPLTAVSAAGNELDGFAAPLEVDPPCGAPYAEDVATASSRCAMAGGSARRRVSIAGARCVDCAVPTPGVEPPFAVGTVSIY